MSVKYPSSFVRSIAILLFALAGLLFLTALSLGGIGDADKKNPALRFDNLKRDTSMAKNEGVIDSDFWKTHDFLNPELPVVVSSRTRSVKVEQKHTDTHGIDTFFREAYPPQGIEPSNWHIVLLHGAAFTSETWEKLGTIQTLASLGHHVVAVDLLGFGKTGVSDDPNNVPSRGAFLEYFVRRQNLGNHIIVSPSMSGSFMFPFIFGMSNKVRGLITVAPVSSEIIPQIRKDNPNIPSLKIPTLILYGDEDTSLGESSTRNLKDLPSSQVYVLPNARHPAYLDQPELFHKLVHNFVMELKERA